MWAVRGGRYGIPQLEQNGFWTSYNSCADLLIRLYHWIRYVAKIAIGLGPSATFLNCFVFYLTNGAGYAPHWIRREKFEAPMFMLLANCNLKFRPFYVFLNCETVFKINRRSSNSTSLAALVISFLRRHCVLFLVATGPCGAHDMHFLEKSFHVYLSKAKRFCDPHTVVVPLKWRQRKDFWKFHPIIWVWLMSSGFYGNTCVLMFTSQVKFLSLIWKKLY